MHGKSRSPGIGEREETSIRLGKTWLRGHQESMCLGRQGRHVFFFGEQPRHAEQKAEESVESRHVSDDGVDDDGDDAAADDDDGGDDDDDDE